MAVSDVKENGVIEINDWETSGFLSVTGKRTVWLR